MVSCPCGHALLFSLDYWCQESRGQEIIFFSSLQQYSYCKCTEIVNNFPTVFPSYPFPCPSFSYKCLGEKIVLAKCLKISWLLEGATGSKKIMLSSIFTTKKKKSYHNLIWCDYTVGRPNQRENNPQYSHYRETV